MTETVIKADAALEIDEEILAEAQWQISAGSPNAAINEALRRLVEHEREKRRYARDQVLHEDADFETVGRFVPELRQRRLSAGPE